MESVLQINEPEKIKENGQCIFCLSDSPAPIDYEGLCECRPKIHKSCLKTWSNAKPDTCPICLKNNIKKDDIVIYQRRNYACAFFSCICCLSACCSPIILLIVFLGANVMPNTPYKHNVTVST
jgi:hypothetical protein